MRLDQPLFVLLDCKRSFHDDPLFRMQIHKKASTPLRNIAKAAGFLTNYMVRLRSHCASKSPVLLKRIINKPSPTAAIMMSVAMKTKVVTSLVRWFILRFMRIGKFPQIKSQHTPHEKS